MLTDSLITRVRPDRRQGQDFWVIETGRLEDWASEHRLSRRQAHEQALAAAPVKRRY